MNFGRVGRELAVEDRDVVLLRATSVHLNVTLGRLVFDVEKKVELLLHLLEAWASTELVNRQELEVVMQLVVSLCSHREWRSGTLGRLGVNCLSKLMRQVRVLNRDEVSKRLRAFCIIQLI